MAKHKVYCYYAELKGFEPKIWRRFEITGEKTMSELAYTVMIMYEMQASHLFSLGDHFYDNLMAKMKGKYDPKRLEFFGMVDKNTKYEIPFEDTMVMENEHFVPADARKLNYAMKNYGAEHHILEYDFGDGWEVVLRLGSIETKEVSLTTLPEIIEGEGFGIIEDAGGLSGHKEIEMALNHKSGKRYSEIVEWLGETTLDLTAFDIGEMNVRIKKLTRFYKNAYEKGIDPTAKELAMLLRQKEM